MQCDSGAAVYEFFAGGGLARIGLGTAWRVTFANDRDAAKACAYRAAFGDDHMHEGDVWDLTPDDLPVEICGARCRAGWLLLGRTRL